MPDLGKYLSDPRVTLIRISENSGQSKAMNAGLHFVKTPYVVQLDSDDWFYPHTLEVLVKEAAHMPEDVGVLSGNIHIVHEDHQGNRIMTEVYKGQNYKDRYDFMLANTSVWPRFYRTAALRSLGGWPTDDPYEGRYLEDKRILYRLIERYRFHWIDQMLYNHRRHMNNQTNQIEIYAEMAEWAVRDALKRWGGEYEPVFLTYGAGWKKVEQLISSKSPIFISSDSGHQDAQGETGEV
ncbi:Glycosyl transferase family 2 [compost metagenome]